MAPHQEGGWTTGYRRLRLATRLLVIAFAVAEVPWRIDRLVDHESQNGFSPFEYAVFGSMLVGLAVRAVWTHRLSGRWPWTGRSVGGVLRGEFEDVGILAHGDEPAFGSKTWHKVAIGFFLALALVIVAAALVDVTVGR
jgi:hypothetical protein